MYDDNMDDFLTGPQCDEYPSDERGYFDDMNDDGESGDGAHDYPDEEPADDDFPAAPELPSDQAFLDMYAPD